jgi:hypothetical protein
MAINQNHPFEELGGIKCAVVERNVCAGKGEVPERVYWKTNKFEVVLCPSPPPKVAAKPAAPAPAEGVAPVEASPVDPEPLAPETFTVGVTDVTFNSTNAIFGRLLRTTDGHVVTRDYWLQKETVSHDDIPYYES